MTNILITGGAGFIGSHLAQSYYRDGKHKVVVLDNLSAGLKSNMYDGLPSEAQKDKNYILVKKDIGKVNLFKLLKKHDIEVVHHLAARPRVKYSVDFPLITHEENATNTLKLLEACKKVGVRRLVNTSSSSIYGAPQNFPTYEDEPKLPQSPYALQKLIGEEYCRLYYELYGFDSVSLRYFNVFGARSTATSEYSAVIPIWIEQMVKRQPVTIDGTGYQARDFTDVANVVHANRLAAFAKSTMQGQGINIACECCYSLKDVIAELYKILQIDYTEEYRPSRPGDVFKTYASYEAAQLLIGYEPVEGFEEGMKNYVKWYLEYLDK